MKFAVLVFPGTSCEADTYDAIKNVLGEDVEFVRHNSEDLNAYDAIILPGGTSYGDAIRPGAIARMQPVMKAVKKAAEAGKPVLGIGNGFQILLETGILPGAVLENRDLKFICKPVQLKVENNDTLFTSTYESGEQITIPIAHGNGNYYADEETLTKLRQNNQIIFTYTTENPNGSMDNIAGISNKQGNVLGMMPHPERAVEQLFGSEDGLRLFQSIVRNWRESHATNA
ncbi:phosphoribosylformylglycinamidine synthase subunit PurQ [Lederbergia lenta]|uniref:Phosphoribosylformylglycinamidine synthase subunit PurQ n=1 Tax=Lederbergia lenta TaxID=1467 RepID=A0A2X4VR37_LEDLE|nr:phosphoribosylformylglycinamidine synthase subunit PurQ [Lederbergia lenta]MCM3110583.1 phosphoribosylformylglycinamidine synthase subunit PurQ [Lederbergia lenta]MEC2325958.1 phosphoribosylformylglycinamidine synthase subunit PurQ [Lederbergia lenta]SQI53443.1 phosphoribosylformylglycinamidine synthase 1 [Lederbergia lenta]